VRIEEGKTIKKKIGIASELSKTIPSNENISQQELATRIMKNIVFS
jgi:hypothetical protein